MSLGFVVAEWEAVSPSLRTPVAWAAWARGGTPDETTESQVPLPPLLRRRITPIGQMAFAAALGTPEISQTRLVFASRHGEFRRTLTLLEALAGSDGVSPADFSLSVHNALMGLLSMWAKNPRGHTTIASGTDTFLCALIEATAMLATDPTTPVLLVYYDEPLPAPYDSFNGPAETALALALLLKSAGGGQQTDVEIEASSADATTAQALGFIRFLLSDEYLAGSRALRLSWRAKRAAA